MLEVLESDHSRKEKPNTVTSEDKPIFNITIPGNRKIKRKEQEQSESMEPEEQEICENSINEEVETYEIISSEHYGALGLNLNVDHNQDIEFNGYGSVRITSRSPVKNRSSNKNSLPKGVVLHNYPERRINYFSPFVKTEKTKET